MPEPPGWWANVWDWCAHVKFAFQVVGTAVAITAALLGPIWLLYLVANVWDWI